MDEGRTRQDFPLNFSPVFPNMLKTSTLLPVVALLAFSAMPCYASVLTKLPYPDIYSRVNVSYQDVGGAADPFDKFTVSGMALKLWNSSSSFDYITGNSSGKGTFLLEAYVDSSGTLSSGTLTIEGAIAGKTSGIVTLLSAQLNGLETSFAASTPDEFRFDFDVTTDVLGIFGNTGRVTVNANTGFIVRQTPIQLFLSP